MTTLLNLLRIQLNCVPCNFFSMFLFLVPDNNGTRSKTLNRKKFSQRVIPNSPDTVCGSAHSMGMCTVKLGDMLCLCMRNERSREVIKSTLKGIHFESAPEVKKKMTALPRQLAEVDWLHRFDQWKIWMRRCVVAETQYTKGEKSSNVIFLY